MKHEFSGEFFEKKRHKYKISWKSFKREPSSCMGTDGRTDVQTDMTNLNEVSPLCISSIYYLLFNLPVAPAGSESYTGTEARPLLQRPATISRKKPTSSKTQSSDKGKLQAPLPQPHLPKEGKVRRRISTTGATRTTKTTTPNSSTHTHTQNTQE